MRALRSIDKGLITVVQDIRESDGVDIVILAVFIVVIVAVSTLGKDHSIDRDSTW